MTRSLEFHRYLARIDPPGNVQRARDEKVAIEPRGTYLWWVRFHSGDHAHRVLLKATDDGHQGICIRLDDCQPDGVCKGLEYSDGPCAHLFAIWSHTARYDRLADDLDVLTECEREVWVRVEATDDYGVREYADLTGRAPGTVGNLLSTARSKLPSVTTDADQQVRADGGEEIEPPTFGADGRQFGLPEGQR
ncbi:MAG: hypothetical protein ACI8XM_000257 [Haloarculaceae archaeon]|jgi:hypothetical protein